MISSSASPIFQDYALLSITSVLMAAPDLLLSITYFPWGRPPQHHLFWPDALLSITSVLMAVPDLLLSITYALARVCRAALQPFSKQGRAPIGTFYLSDELHSRQQGIFDIYETLP